LIKLVPNIEKDLLFQKIVDKLGWLFEYKSDLERWSLMVKMTRTLEIQLKHFGLNKESLATFENTVSSFTDTSLKDFKQNIVNYLVKETSKISSKDTFLATTLRATSPSGTFPSTDVLESLFGKYKNFSARSPLNQINQLLFTIVLSTTNLTANFLKEALETIRFVDVENWANQIFGSSALSKRKTLFSASVDDIEFV